jgi:hypothetical protein
VGSEFKGKEFVVFSPWENLRRSPFEVWGFESKYIDVFSMEEPEKKDKCPLSRV